MASSTDYITPQQAFEPKDTAIGYVVRVTPQSSVTHLRAHETVSALENAGLTNDQHHLQQNPIPTSEEDYRGKPQFLVCPCHAYAPDRFSAAYSSRYRSCAGGFRDMNRLKEHLGCYGPKKGRHCRVENGRFSAPADITDTQFNEIKCRLKRGLSAVTAWKTIFGVLYPNIEPIPSPYVQRGISQPRLHSIARRDSWIDNHKRPLVEACLSKLDAVFGGHIQEPFRTACTSVLNETVFMALEARGSNLHEQTHCSTEGLNKGTRSPRRPPNYVEVKSSFPEDDLQDAWAFDQFEPQNIAEPIGDPASDVIGIAYNAPFTTNVTSPSGDICFPSSTLLCNGRRPYLYQEDLQESFDTTGYEKQSGITYFDDCDG